MALRIFYIFVALFAVLAIVQMAQILMTHRQIATTPISYSFGPEDADLEVVEFIDYSCPFCQMVHPTIMEAVRRDGKVRYLPKPLPAQNQRAAMAAMIVYAAGKQGKFIEMHNALIENFPDLTDQRIAQIALSLGINEEQYNTDIKDPETHKPIMENARMYTRLDTNATPTFLIGRKIVYVPEGRMPTPDDFLRMFEEARAQQ